MENKQLWRAIDVEEFSADELFEWIVLSTNAVLFAVQLGRKIYSFSQTLEHDKCSPEACKRCQMFYFNHDYSLFIEALIGSIFYFSTSCIIEMCLFQFVRKWKRCKFKLYYSLQSIWNNVSCCSGEVSIDKQSIKYFNCSEEPVESSC